MVRIKYFDPYKESWESFWDSLSPRQRVRLRTRAKIMRKPIKAHAMRSGVYLG